jgi:hypothetical protein
MELRDHQKKAIKQLSNGKILWGGVGSGKTATALGYYMANERPKDIYVITTAKKRDSGDWFGEAAAFGLTQYRDATVAGTITVDSWNNIGNYTDCRDAFFIFDEQRLVGSGAWVKAFQKIAKRNRWILLSGTPGDNWMDYAPVFIANGFYKNITDFKFKHVIYEPFNKFPKIRMYINESKLELMRNDLLVEMPYPKHTKRFMNWLEVGYDIDIFKRIYKDRWNVFEERPVKDVAELFRLMRRAVNSDPSRLEMVRTLMKSHDRLIIFYNFNYELEMLRTLHEDVEVKEWNGHRKDPLPTGDKWIYLVQYVAGAEGWNCITTDAMILYSMTYSYKNFEQAMGRIDRMNTPYTDLFYYILGSNSLIDRAIKRSLESKESFNEKKFAWESGEIEEIYPHI